MARCEPVPCQLLGTEAIDTIGRVDGHLLLLLWAALSVRTQVAFECRPTLHSALTSEEVEP